MLAERGFAVDTNLFVFPAARRLLHGFALETGNEIFILPEVEAEVTHGKHLRDAEVQRWCRRTGRSYKQILDRGSDHIISAIDKSSLEWYKQETSRPDGVFRHVELKAGQEQDVSLIARTLPKRIFRHGVTGEPPRGDPLIVAQAIFLGVDLLSTNNLNTIDHEELNKWLRSRGWNRNLAHTPSQTLEALSNYEIERVYTHFLAHGTNRVFPDTPQNRAEVLRGLDVLANAGFGRRDYDFPSGDAFKSMVYRLHAQLEADQDFKSNFENAVNSPHRATAIDTELRLNRRINLAIEKAEEAHG
ncbi:MAG: hypothetical protein OXF72_07160 [Gammaproteobacteria bacterium]|nr:hypothetical protein [Gammaproteobacteria bacterium]MCY4278824.1 hypothetical protein [Gammaproteobacteria bacterium]